VSLTSHLVRLPCALLLAGLACAAPGGDASSSSVDDSTGSDEHAGADDESADNLRLEPAEADLFSTSDQAATQAFKLYLRDERGAETDVTAQAVFTLDDAELGAFAGARLSGSTTRAGESRVLAAFGESQARARVRLHLTAIRIGTGAPSDAASQFDQAVADPALAPGLLYPSDGTIVPPNLSELELHFSGAGELYELSLTGALASLRLFTRGQAGESAGLWERIAASDWSMVAEAARGGSVSLTVRALSAGRVGSSAPSTLFFTHENMKGGIYFWSPPGGIFRHDFDAPTSESELVYGGGEGAGLGGGFGDGCVGCHALSADGTRMAVSTDVLESGAATVIDVATGEPLFAPSSAAFDFAAFDPTGEQLVTTRQGELTVRDAATGAVTSSLSFDGRATHPDVSPAGTRVVFAKIGMPSALTLGDAANAFALPAPPFPELPIGFGLDLGNLFFTGGSLWLSPLTGAQLGPPTMLHTPPSGTNAYYPSFSPDDAWVLFNQSQGDAYNDGDATLHVIDSRGGAPPITLGQANGPAHSTNSWPRWAPFEQTTGGGERVLWFTFSSTRAFGVRALAGKKPQLWMAAFFPERAGEQASSPAFRLPFQQLSTGNHIAQWTREVVPVVQ
jgi:hypothetical protein